MEERKSPDSKPEGFFAGKGFYIVLILCAAVIGVSAWSLIRGTGTVDEPGTNDIVLQEPEDYDASLINDPDYDSSLWEIPEGVQEVLAEVEPPDVVANNPTEPEPEPAPVAVNEPEPAFIWPIAGRVDTPYCVTALMYDQTMADWRTHDGVDVAAEIGERVMAAASGTVTKVYHDDFYGTTVVIDHGSGLTGTYSNLQEIPAVSEGDFVLGGETIGAVGHTALCESGQPPHLHYSMSLNGQSVNPADYLPAL